MPKSTFYRLNAAKRRRIEEAAREIFLRHPYREVTISRIVDMAGIPRGSFYQYFEDLEDLFQYLFEHAVELYEAYVFERIKHYKGDVFTFLKDSFEGDYAYLAASDFHELKRKFFRERQPLGVSVDFFQKRRDEFYESLLEASEDESLNHLAREEKIKLMRLVTHTKVTLLSKVFLGELDYDEAHDDYVFYIDLIRRGVEHYPHA